MTKDMTVPVMHRYFKVSCNTCEEQFLSGEIKSEDRLRVYCKKVNDARKEAEFHYTWTHHKAKIEEITKQDITDVL